MLVFVLLAVTGAALSQATSSSGPMQIIIVSQPRSGSTTSLMTVSSLLGSAFPIIEPYGHDPKQIRSRPFPSYGNMFSCEFTRNRTLVSEIFWSFPCREHPLTSIPGRRKRCLSHTMSEEDFQAIETECTLSQFRVIKTLRFQDYKTLVGREVEADMLALSNPQAIFLVRHPWYSVKSEFILGWIGNTTTTLHAALDYSCNTMLQSWKKLEATLGLSRLMLMRYEDYEMERERTIIDIAHFLNINVTQSKIDDTLHQIAALRSGSIPRHANPETESDRQRIIGAKTDAEWIGELKTHPTCLAALRHFYGDLE